MRNSRYASSTFSPSGSCKSDTPALKWLFASSLVRSQVVAAILGAAFAAPLVLLWMIARAVDPPLNRFLSGLSLHHENFRPFMNGILQLQGVAYYLMITYFFLLAATKVLEARRWR